MARFTGLAGELRVKVVKRTEDGTVEVTAAGGGVFPRLRPSGGQGSSVTLQPGAEAILAIRPTGVYLARTAEDDQHLTGRVADVAFRGRGCELAIDLAA